MTERVDIKRGEAFDQTVVIPDDFADGYFAGSAVSSQVRDAVGTLVADLECAWIDQSTTREIRLFGETDAWPIGRLYTDVHIERASDRLSRYTDTVVIRVKASITEP